MGPEIEIVAIEVIQGGLIQVDIKGDECGHLRLFIEPEEMMEALGKGMVQASRDYLIAAGYEPEEDGKIE